MLSALNVFNVGGTLGQSLIVVRCFVQMLKYLVMAMDEVVIHVGMDKESKMVRENIPWMSIGIPC